MTPPKASRRSKRPKPTKSKRRRFDLIERKGTRRRCVEFPQVQGRIVDRIEFSSASNYHAITIDFKDKTSLTLTIDPAFLLGSRFLDISTGDERVRKRWPLIQSVTDK
jgi:hypothetical protein